MTDECIICGGPGGFYLTSGPHRAGPFCASHRWRLGVYITKQCKQACKSRFNEWLEAYLKLGRKKQDAKND